MIWHALLVAILATPPALVARWAYRRTTAPR